MKKYKLIKKYPGSPPLGSKVNECILDTSQRVYQLRATVCKPPLSIHIVEMQPEFWKEIIEKDYEILSFMRINSTFYSGLIKTKKPNGNFTFDFITGNDTEERLLSCSGFTIHSVKRLSDGEIFTVGEHYINKNNMSFGIRKINSFNITDTNEIYINNSSTHLKNWGKVKDKLFTTEDGVDIFPKEDGEFQYWSLKLDNWEISNAPHILNSNKIIPTKTEELLQCCNELRFSTKEAAEEYIILHKPCLSISDILNNSKLLKDGVICQGLRQYVKTQIFKWT